MTEFRMPSLGSGMEQGTLVEWLKKPGDRISAGDIIAVIETEKGAIEIEAYNAGTFSKALVGVGNTVPVGTPIAILDGAEEAPMPSVEKGAARPVLPPPPAASEVTPVAARSTGQPGLKVSPAARRLAEERGVALESIKGTGPEGSVVYVDVENALAGHSGRPKTDVPRRAASGIDIAAMRTVIATATSRSNREIPHYFLLHDVDVTGMMAGLAARNAPQPPAKRILPAAVWVKAVADACRRQPGFNGFFGDGTFSPAERINVGVAITIRGGGLVAPAIHDADRLTLDEVMERLTDLVSRVRAGRFRSSELSDSTITLTNLGERGVDSVVPIIYPPQVSIIGVGTPRERPWVVNGKVEPRQVVTLSLAGDHRASNGHEGALFLAMLAGLVQNAEIA